MEKSPELRCDFRLVAILNHAAKAQQYCVKAERDGASGLPARSVGARLEEAIKVLPSRAIGRAIGRSIGRAMTQNNLGVALGALGERQRKLLTQGIKTEVADFIGRAKVGIRPCPAIRNHRWVRFSISSNARRKVATRYLLACTRPMQGAEHLR
jgi:hypothetical protein